MDCNQKKSKNSECMDLFSSYAHENGLKEKLFALLPRKSVCDLNVNVRGYTSGGECVCVLQCTFTCMLHLHVAVVCVR